MGLVLIDLGMTAAGLLALTFAWAGAAKLGRPAETAAGFADLGLARPGALARAVPLVELALAVTLLAAPAAGGAAALVLLAGFSAVLVGALRRGVAVPCACFGRAGSPPLSGFDLARNALLAALAGVALTAGLAPQVPGFVPATAVLLTTVAAFALLAVLRRGRP